jgi:hypothetical protein
MTPPAWGVGAVELVAGEIAGNVADHVAADDTHPAGAAVVQPERVPSRVGDAAVRRRAMPWPCSPFTSVTAEAGRARHLSTVIGMAACAPAFNVSPAHRWLRGNGRRAAPATVGATAG